MRDRCWERMERGPLVPELEMLLPPQCCGQVYVAVHTSRWLEIPATCWLWVAEFVGLCCRIVWPFMWACKHSCACRIVVTSRFPLIRFEITSVWRNNEWSAAINVVMMPYVCQVECDRWLSYWSEWSLLSWLLLYCLPFSSLPMFQLYINGKVMKSV